MHRVLFVDDEVNILHGLRRMLRNLRNQYELMFAQSAEEAIHLFRSMPIDILVTDLRMPEKDGVYLLEQVRSHFPGTVRIVLSGYADKEISLKTVGLAHQFISKPAEPEKLINAINRASSLHQIMNNPEIARLILRLNSIPSLPDLYYKIVAELNSPETSIRKVGEIVSKDMGMTTRILQLVNSSFFGLPTRVDNPIQATTLLGLVTIRDLALSLHVFSQFNEQLLSRFNLSNLWDHSVRVGGFSKIILNDLISDPKRREMGFVLGMLHDLGKLVLAQNLPDQYQQVVDLMGKEEISVVEAEYQIFQSTHAQIGAYLLGVWGLDEAVMDVAAFHHDPRAYTGKHQLELAAVYIANCFDHSFSGGKRPPLEKIELDLEFIKSLNLESYLPAWHRKWLSYLMEGIQHA